MNEELEILDKNKQIAKLEDKLEEKNRLLNHHREVYDVKQGEITEKNKLLKEKDLMIHAIKTDQVSYKVDIVNDTHGEGCFPNPSCKIILISDIMFAFYKDTPSLHGNGIVLRSKHENNDWVEVSDLTELKISEYKELKSFAIAVGMITEEQDLFI